MYTTERVNRVKEINLWYEKNENKNLVKKLLPEHAEDLSRYYLIRQDKNEPHVAGIYSFILVQGSSRHSAYVGESGNVYRRLLEHFYNLVTDETKWGIPTKAVKSGDIKIEWSCTTGITDVNLREAEEARLINTLKPFLQYTDPNAPEYGTDKRVAGKAREDIRPDFCVCKELRKARAKALFDLDKE